MKLKFLIILIVGLSSRTLLQLKSLATLTTVALPLQPRLPVPEVSPRSGANLEGDWLFRRLRLDLVDQEIYKIRPDILLFQEMMMRRGSPSESDKNILSYGSLDGYQWSKSVVGRFEDTQEEQLMAFAVGLSFRFAESENHHRMRELVDGLWPRCPLFWRAKTSPCEPPASLRSRKFPAWYQVIENFIREQLRYDICLDRLIVGGFLGKGKVQISIALPRYCPCVILGMDFAKS